MSLEEQEQEQEQEQSGLVGLSCGIRQVPCPDMASSLGDAWLGWPLPAERHATRFLAEAGWGVPVLVPFSVELVVVTRRLVNLEAPREVGVPLHHQQRPLVVLHKLPERSTKR